MNGSVRVRWRARLLILACACLVGAGAAFVAMIVLARVVPDAPPYLFLHPPKRVAGWVALDRFLFVIVCLGLLAAGSGAGAAAKLHRPAISVLLVSSCVGVVGLLLLGVLWGTGETAEDLGFSVAWLGTASLVAAMLTVLAGAAAAAAGLVLGLLVRRTSTAIP